MTSVSSFIEVVVVISGLISSLNLVDFTATSEDFSFFFLFIPLFFPEVGAGYRPAEGANTALCSSEVACFFS